MTHPEMVSSIMLVQFCSGIKGLFAEVALGHSRPVLVLWMKFFLFLRNNDFFRRSTHFFVCAGLFLCEQKMLGSLYIINNPIYRAYFKKIDFLPAVYRACV